LDELKAVASDNISDKELIDRCLSGKENGYTMLYHRYAKSIFNSIYRLLGDVQESEDLLQEVFLMVFSEMPKMKELRSFPAWANRVAINRSISQLRKKKVYFTVIEDATIIDTSEEEISAKQSLEGKIEDVQQAIAELPLETRTIVNLFLFEDMPHQEIGELLGLSHNTVRSQYHRAKRKIIQNLKQRSYHE